jgi:hypothetical protein
MLPRREGTIFKYFPTDLNMHAHNEKMIPPLRVLISTAIGGHACFGSTKGTTFLTDATGSR